MNFQPRLGGPGNMRRGSLEHYMPDLKDASAKGTLMEPRFFVTGREAPQRPGRRGAPHAAGQLDHLDHQSLVRQGLRESHLGRAGRRRLL